LKATIDPDDHVKRIFAMLFSIFLRNPHSSSRDAHKALFTSKTTILRVFTGLGLRFYKVRSSCPAGITNLFLFTCHDYAVYSPMVEWCVKEV
jgi:hypothetical protein